MWLLDRLSPRDSPPDRVTIGLLVVVVLAAVAAGWSGWSWWQASHDQGLARAHARDAVVHDAREALVTLHTVDYRTAQADTDKWQTVTTDDYDSGLVAGDDDQRKQVKKSKTVSSAEVGDIAVTKLNSRRDTARVIATLRAEVRTGEQKPQQRHSMLQATLTDTKDGWKISGLQAAT